MYMYMYKHMERILVLCGILVQVRELLLVVTCISTIPAVTFTVHRTFCLYSHFKLVQVCQVFRLPSGQKHSALKAKYPAVKHAFV